jgi:hypothetical protein
VNSLIVDFARAQPSTKRLKILGTASVPSTTNNGTADSAGVRSDKRITPSNRINFTTNQTNLPVETNHSFQYNLLTMGKRKGKEKSANESLVSMYATRNVVNILDRGLIGTVAEKFLLSIFFHYR